jgi:hypothetical protein
MKIVTIKKYCADDGTEFDSYYDCYCYELIKRIDDTVTLDYRYWSETQGGDKMLAFINLPSFLILNRKVLSKLLKEQPK